MPLSPSVPREHIHSRQIELRGYRREDGLWDIEGHLTDTKTYGFTNEFRGEVEPGTPIHDMWLRLTVDDTLTIRGVEAVTDASPYRICPEITSNFQRLVGLQIKPGFNGKVKQLLGGVEGCTHLVELVGPLATTAFQTIYPWKNRQGDKAGRAVPGKRPRLLETCHAFATDSEVVKRLWPEFYRGS
jgi:hypothetical protein